MNKQQRQYLIRDIISRGAIAQQEDLLRALRTHGEEVNQATLSRDLRELGASRTQTPEGPRYILQEEGHLMRLRALLSYEVISIEANEQMVVVKTLAGRAQGVAEQIDHLKIPTILATLAGDNTIFISPTSVQHTKSLEKQLKKLIVEQQAND